jgi:hypothetical protein
MSQLRFAIFIAILSTCLCLLTSPASYGFDLKSKGASQGWGTERGSEEFPGHKLPTAEAREKFYEETTRQVREMMKHYNPVTGKLDKNKASARKPLTGEDIFKARNQGGCKRKTKSCVGSRNKSPLTPVNKTQRAGQNLSIDKEVLDRVAKQAELVKRQKMAPRPKKAYLLLPLNGVERHGELYKSMVSLWKSDLEKDWDVFVWIMCPTMQDGMRYVSQNSVKVAMAFGGSKMELPLTPVHGTEIESSVDLSRLPAVVFEVDGKKPESVYRPRHAQAAYAEVKEKGVL